MNRASTLSTLRVNLLNAPSGGSTRTFTVYLNAVATSLTISLTGATTVALNSVNTVSVAAGDFVSLFHTTTGAPAASSVMASLNYNY